MAEPLTTTDFPGLGKPRRGKVRDIYELPEGLLIVATDRLSAFDVVFREGIPGKGAVLTALSAWWFRRLSDIVDNHLISVDVERMVASAHPFAAALRGRSMLVRKARVLPVECIARGYLAGSGHKEYERSGSVCGVALPPGLVLSSKLPEPIYTPSTKAETGHDENISFEASVGLLGRPTAERLRELTLALYRAGAETLAERGIILCDTKFEFGVLEDGRIILVDEALTPDSSRFWDRTTWREGVAQDSFDKQIVRDYLSGLSWDRSPPPPALPPEVIAKTAARYREIAERITGLRMEGVER
ncbi:MAG: phosphoribosylaminoimidazolesuccinocarboxamide synthase [Planctomycetes bacterium]|nr:phosphoribosylaminoimidazolesuccinocarboxamide synthase [Planctomycetota bacterium]